MYGISQNPNTKDYIIVLQNKYYCEKCGEKYTGYIENINNKWCNPCSINYFKNNFTNWTSGNDIIDDFIQKMQLKINRYDDMILEWIPYNQFVDVKEIEKFDDNITTIYSALWNGGLLHYNSDKKEWIRKPNIKVVLKCLNNSQNIIYEFLNEV
jgi:hypothetical protein